MKPIKLDNKELMEAVKEGKEPYVLVGDRKFLLYEIEQASDSEYYEVTDPEEKKELLEALNGDNPILSKAQIDDMMKR